MHALSFYPNGVLLTCMLGHFTLPRAAWVFWPARQASFCLFALRLVVLTPSSLVLSSPVSSLLVISSSVSISVSGLMSQP